MNGREVYKFAVKKFKEVIEDALESTGLGVDDISQFICHQSNIRIIESAKEKIGLPDEKVYINIDKYGNSSAGSVGSLPWTEQYRLTATHVLFHCARSHDHIFHTLLAQVMPAPKATMTTWSPGLIFPARVTWSRQRATEPADELPYLSMLM